MPAEIDSLTWVDFSNSIGRTVLDTTGSKSTKSCLHLHSFYVAVLDLMASGFTNYCIIYDYEKDIM